MYKKILFLSLCLLMFLLAACGSSGTDTGGQATPTAVAVNGFGSASNHGHSLLALPNNVLLLATHYGTFRSEDGGAHWTQVTGGPNQLLHNLMNYSLVVSPLDSQRLYMLSQPALGAPANPKEIGLYTSSDQGRTWKESIPAASISSSYIFTAAAGNDTPEEVYIYLRELGPLGLKVSLDAGQHFSSTGTLPFGDVARILAIPGQPGHLLVAGSSGVASSSDGGTHWQLVSGVNGAVYEFSNVDKGSPIYATGDQGIYVSHNEGKSFQLVTTQASYASLSIAPAQPEIVYGKTGKTIYRSTDGGHSWKPLPTIQGNLTNLAVNPANAMQVYLSLSYPMQVYTLKPNDTAWSSLTPKA